MTDQSAPLRADAPPDTSADVPPEVDPARLGDMVVAGAVLYLLIANAPGLYRGSPILLAMVAWPLGAVGLVGLGILAWRRVVPARWAGGFLGWGLVAVAASAQPRLSLEGGWFGDRGWVYLACYLGCWAIGRRRGHSAVAWVTGALVVGLVLNALIAFVQTTVPDGEGLIALQEGRAAGFTINPVYLGGLMAGGVALVGRLTASSGHRRWWVGGPALVLLAGAANLSGSRISFAAVLVLGPAAAVVAARRGEGPWLRVAVVAGAILAGLVLGALALPGGGGTGRVTEGSGGSGVANRALMWRAGVDATLERPIVGWGPNRFRPATSPAITASFVRNEGTEGEYPDAHNVLVELATTTGLPGLVLALGFAWTAARRARGPLAWYAAGVAVTWLFEPITDATVPTALLALGLAAVAIGDRPDPPLARPPARAAARVAAVVLALLALVGAGRLLVIDHRMEEAYGAVDPVPGIESAHDVAPDDLAVNALLADALIERATRTGSAVDANAAVAAAERTLDIDPTLPKALVDLGRARMLVAADGTRAEQLDGAAEAFSAAREQNPWSAGALDGLLAIAVERDDAAAIARWKAALCEIRGC